MVNPEVLQAIDDSHKLHGGMGLKDTRESLVLDTRAIHIRDYCAIITIEEGLNIGQIAHKLGVSQSKLSNARWGKSDKAMDEILEQFRNW